MENLFLTPIQDEESKTIFGGDKFSTELGIAFGSLCGSIRNAAVSGWNFVGGLMHSEANSEWMLNVPAIYLFQ